MRYDLTDFEWSVIEPLLPKGKPGPVPKNNRQVLNGIFWVLRAGAPWRDLPNRYGPYTTAYNRFNRWRKAGVWDRLMDAVTKAHDGKLQMIDSSIVRVHQHAAGAKKGVVGSIGQRNSSSQSNSWRLEAKCFSWPAIELVSHGIEFLLAVTGEVRTLREILPEKAIGIFVAAALPWTPRVAEVNTDVCRNAELLMVREFCAAIPCKR